mmetsp:Transcript_21811/g.33743  ORF Transcript_21811/g.33743 Transcript_21811/m.33743 type:complete len:87 (+) Transcript_21811:1524-1784(+)
MLEEAVHTSFNAAFFMNKGPVVIHCNTGNDGSSVISSLAQLIADPFYRTFEGFKVLFYKEWLWFFHNFVSKHSLVLHGQDGQPAHG